MNGWAIFEGAGWNASKRRNPLARAKPEFIRDVNRNALTR